MLNGELNRTENSLETILAVKELHRGTCLSLGMEQLIQSLGILGNGLPSMSEIQAWSVPNPLMFGRAKVPKKFVLEHRVLKDC